MLAADQIAGEHGKNRLRAAASHHSEGGGKSDGEAGSMKASLMMIMVSAAIDAWRFKIDRCVNLSSVLTVS
jgi:hypothetical protein